MRDRIQRIMTEGNFTPSLFADKLNIGRAVLSHILNGRNKPSLDVVTRILETMPDINSEWLLFGSGEMYKRAAAVDDAAAITTTPLHKGVQSQLFAYPDQNDVVDRDQVSDAGTSDVSQYSNINTPPDTEEEQTNKPTVVPVIKTVAKDISKIIIYYADNTFQAFNPDQTAL